MSIIDKYVDFGDKKSNPRTQPISKITIHHMAGILDAEYCANYHLNSERDVSANYYIGKDGTICQGVREERRAWTSANRENDFVAITIEVSNNSREPNWTVGKEAYDSLIKLCVDICKRYNIVLKWTGDKDGTLTCHYMFKDTECPGPYLKGKMADIAKEVNEKCQINNI